MSANDPYRRIAGVYDRLIEPMQAGVRKVALDVLPPQHHSEGGRRHFSFQRHGRSRSRGSSNPVR